ncbi:MAG: hypothetical protein IKC64_03955 [Clostridia bacterium]|nr:hypothetical protein [Clostridia bacterium]
MLKFSKSCEIGAISLYNLLDDGVVKATAKVVDNLIEQIEYADEKTKTLYSAFVVRSLAFLLRDKHETVKVAFYDDNFARIGFERDGDGMKIKSLYMNFSGCCSSGCNAD